MLRIYLTSFTIFIASLNLAACGGGGSGGSSNSSPTLSNTNPQNLYTGNTELALLNNNNGITYMRHLIAYEQLDDLATTPTSAQKMVMI